MSDRVIELLGSGHDRGAFSCGNTLLDEFLRRFANQHADRDFTRTFVATQRGSPAVLGYYSLSAGSLDLELLPESVRRRLPRHPVPVAHLGRLAVDRTVHGQGWGAYLLFDALRRSLRISAEFGVFGVEVFAIDESARDFYRHFGFEALTDDPLHLYLAMKTIRRLPAGPSDNP